MKKTLAVTTMAIVAVAAAVPAFAQVQDVPTSTVGGGKGIVGKSGGKYMRRGGGERFAKLQQILTPAQKDEFKALMQQSREESKPLFERMVALRAQMRGGGSMDDKTKAEFVALRKQMKERREANQAKLMALLTPEQKAQLEASGGLPSFGGGKFGGEGKVGRRGQHRNADNAGMLPTQ
jgi:Spy/CpxP family protein refolding chaperone